MCYFFFHFYRASLKAEGYDLPKGNSQIQKLVIKKYGQVQDEMKTDLTQLKQKGARYTVTTDEYTSSKNRRYININIHVPGNFFSLGVPRAHGTMPATRQLEVLTDRLSNFDLQFERDIIAITTDGASVMKKLGKLLKQGSKVGMYFHMLLVINFSTCYSLLNFPLVTR